MGCFEQCKELLDSVEVGRNLLLLSSCIFFRSLHWRLGGRLKIYSCDESCIIIDGDVFHFCVAVCPRLYIFGRDLGLWLSKRK
jgi:hypothetical protein